MLFRSLPASSAQYFNLLVKYENTKNAVHRDELLKQMAAKKKTTLCKILPADVFKIISDWHHPAILVLLKVKDFKNDVKWIADRLGIKEAQAAEALNRLLETQLIKKTLEGELVLSDNMDLGTTDGIASKAIRENHRQQNELAKKALTEQTLATQEFNNVTLCMSPKNIAKAKTLIREFTERFATELDEDGGEELFQINVQFFQLTK